MSRFASPVLAAVLLAASGALALAANPPAQPAAAPASSALHQNRRAGDRMNEALNLLEAQGYGDFSNFKPDGQNYAATVSENGQRFGVVINPDSGQITRQG